MILSPSKLAHAHTLKGKDLGHHEIPHHDSHKKLAMMAFPLNCSSLGDGVVFSIRIRIGMPKSTEWVFDLPRSTLQISLVDFKRGQKDLPMFLISTKPRRRVIPRVSCLWRAG
ncbi:hypothetical protein M406DRAFT_355953 [Cryphonectria parasitica EP155]|uniref:Uncharacterized protein n=1 Tax=Cryphonectria parasitica (strain ATCC 38755 / EP155) TaxID=660469 RepID=A0A9P4Y1Z0_CRYP1|nr:uncharacterized protein M406DRAFT_355953 [Cryphonectria parasitica EP155]KAF3765519.1 hypothetical protein M406DRAFT_355953 [Cryphonectria parasitica EP155]